MRYDHAAHAGNHGDLLKHAVLGALLAALPRHAGSWRLLDLHAGAGRYRLPPRAAARRLGHRLRTRGCPAPLRPWLAAQQDALAGGAYLGSPLLLRAALTPGDRLHLVEAHGPTLRRLHAALAGDSRPRLHHGDGWRLGPTLLTRRSLLLIDPPWLSAADGRRAAALLRAVAAQPDGVALCWYPLHDGGDTLAGLVPPAVPWLAGELRFPAPRPGLRGSGVLVLRPPAALRRRLPALLDALAAALAMRPRCHPGPGPRRAGAPPAPC